MNKLLLSILSIQFFFVLLYSETDFPPFKDPLNQLDFETKRIYVDSVRVYKSTAEFHVKYYNYIRENSEIWKKYNDIQNNDIRPSSIFSAFSNKNKATTSAISNRAIALLSGEDEKLFSFEADPSFWHIPADVPWCRRMLPQSSHTQNRLATLTG